MSAELRAGMRRASTNASEPEARELSKQLHRLCYVRKGSGSTRGQLSIIVKQQTDENVEAADLLIRSLFNGVMKSSRGTYVVTA